MKSILIAEGDDRVAALFADLFARDGWTVTTCVDGQHAANALSGAIAYEHGVVRAAIARHVRVELITQIRALKHRQARRRGHSRRHGEQVRRTAQATGHVRLARTRSAGLRGCAGHDECRRFAIAGPAGRV